MALTRKGPKSKSAKHQMLGKPNDRDNIIDLTLGDSDEEVEEQPIQSDIQSVQDIAAVDRDYDMDYDLSEDSDADSHCDSGDEEDLFEAARLSLASTAHQTYDRNRIPRQGSATAQDKHLQCIPNQTSHLHISNAPTEILLNIFKHLEPIPGVVFGLTCRRFHAIYKDINQHDWAAVLTSIRLTKKFKEHHLFSLLKDWAAPAYTYSKDFKQFIPTNLYESMRGQRLLTQSMIRANKEKRKTLAADRAEEAKQTALAAERRRHEIGEARIVRAWRSARRRRAMLGKNLRLTTTPSWKLADRLF